MCAMVSLPQQEHREIAMSGQSRHDGSLGKGSHRLPAVMRGSIVAKPSQNGPIASIQPVSFKEREQDAVLPAHVLSKREDAASCYVVAVVLCVALPKLARYLSV